MDEDQADNQQCIIGNGADIGRELVGIGGEQRRRASGQGRNGPLPAGRGRQGASMQAPEGAGNQDRQEADQASCSSDIKGKHGQASASKKVAQLYQLFPYGKF